MNGEYVIGPVGHPGEYFHQQHRDLEHLQLQEQLHLKHHCQHPAAAGPYSSRQHGPEPVGAEPVAVAADLASWLDAPFGSSWLASVGVTSPDLPTAAAVVVEGSEVEHPFSAAEVAPEGHVGPVARYLAGQAAACVHQRQPSSQAVHLVVDPCGLEHLPRLLGSVTVCPELQPSLLSLGAPCSSADPAGGEGEKPSSLQLLLVSAEPSFFEHQLPVESSMLFLPLLVEGQRRAAVAAAAEVKADLMADWEVVDPLHFQPWQHHQAAVAGEMSQNRGLVYPGTGEVGKSLVVCWHKLANYWSAAGAAES